MSMFFAIDVIDFNSSWVRGRTNFARRVFTLSFVSQWERFSPDESKLAELIVTHVIGTTPMLLTMKLKPVD